MISHCFLMVVVGVAHTGDGESGNEAGEEFKDHVDCVVACRRRSVVVVSSPPVNGAALYTVSLLGVYDKAMSSGD